MADHVLTARIYFGDVGNAENAFNHIKALAEHSAAHDRMVGDKHDSSWARVHTCHAVDHDGDTSMCATTHRFVLEGPPPPGEIRTWAPDQSYVLDDQCEHNDIIYRMIQPTHTTQVGWEPPNVPAIWEVV